MSQSTFDDEVLFEEAAADIRTDVETYLDAARNSLPEPEEIWTVDVGGENTLGVLNTLGQALDLDDAADHLQDAKKPYTMGERADAFENADELADQIATLAAVRDRRC